MNKTQYTPVKLAKICNAEVLSSGHDADVRFLINDSREIPPGEGGMFIAIRGLRHDGHNYLEQAFENGVRIFLIDNKAAFEKLPTDIKQKSSFIFSGNSIDALQEIAGSHRSQFNIPIIAITGSNGKTIVKEWLYHLLKDHYHVYKSPKSYNSQVGVPLSLWNINEEHEIAVIEAGISMPGEMEKLERIIKPTFGIFTNLGPAHQAHFSSMEEKAKEKLKLFLNVKQLVFCQEHELIRHLIMNSKDQGFFRNQLEMLDWGSNPDAYLQIKAEEVLNDKTVISAKYGADIDKYAIPFTDRASRENAMHAITAALKSGIKPTAIQHALPSLEPVEMRMQFKKGINESLIINDSYNLDIDSLRLALEQLIRQDQFARHVLILSDILESGMEETELYKKVAKEINRVQPDEVVAIGKALVRNRGLFPENTSFFESTGDFLRHIKPESYSRACILLKGARPFQFEQIESVFQQKHHSTVLEIDLDALVHNLNTYRSRLNSDTRIMAMVKAFSYGSGAVEVARMLEYQRVDYLGVAYADEGVELRKAGIRIPVMVMNPEPASFHAMIRYNLEPEIYSMRILNLYQEVTKLYDRAPGIHLKVDTGMHRLGFSIKEAKPLVQKLKTFPNLSIKSVFSHLSVSEDANETEFTRQQLQTFETFCGLLDTAGIDMGIKHILNTAGILGYPEAQYNMVRLGLGLYGVDITGKIESDLETGITFKTVISQIKELEAGSSIGYGRKGMVNRKSQIATIMAGYADGIRMSLGNGNGRVLVQGQMAPFIGNICMDMSMIDVTGMSVSEGDEVYIFGEQPNVKSVAEKAGTIPYDILAGISPRVKRVYFQK